MPIQTTGRDVTHRLEVEGLRCTQETISQTTHESFLDVEKGHDVEELFDLQGRNMLLNLEDTGNFR
jgi:hypothetical protein